ncbi:MAG: hypothetical protein A2268_05355 [Candidatus Raymondbacteria bacterium RifOxyA12_full_50_37]|uniref:Secretion system C-terminal sorting domain-containing protein n=1 Tax=Candidatus Raymondbacteria bacterium RIFOXYD12_FULL_49_13 TaxID=1817890 RepID=A0A1F7FC07_UNCRA|nr:MAG: hypothetical protein A2268_05355 [Candidatus Raymondbacteria bacterium RifOxyA12_full_50_37]OGJ88991.1 MAG: hypothetical protein A2248_02590 [Candidatus Raymondbacteria bacterium RIFOXYA2_FULL_49_16]OGJ92500.1 MAG: hypothetical protein A2350_15735 [Candidatus Raymondbacteria bacterium RifOxyB12_full_50_8]OGJ97019.1 MAG: hypothetical protein A2453_04010 [Candidatus Raymondbacteria bacterium RIFOXYC2_FULL_50_21]OGK02563.1 MAG: hypothetical protein A2487_15080 [Candidatus Raymondbacteria b
MRYLIIALVAIAACPYGQDAITGPARVLVVYNTNSSDADKNGLKDSWEIAQYYCSRRSIPSQNMCSVTTANTNNYIGDTAFFNQIVVPIRAKIDSIGQDSIVYIVLCKGVPLRVTGYASGQSLDNKIAAIYALGSTGGPYSFSTKTNPYYENSVLGASVNGHFNHTQYKVNTYNMYLVCRLEASTVQKTKDLIEMTLYGEKYIFPGAGYYNGIGYVDSRYATYSDADLAAYPFGYGSYGNADKDMAYGKYFVDTAGYERKWEPTGANIGSTSAVFSDGSSAALAPNALWYGGWYNFQHYNDSWEWLPGSIACDLNSDSYMTFLNGAFKHGLTAGCGVVGEPYLNGHTQPEKLLWAIFHGYTFGEASYFSDPYLCWMTANGGDPLYCPHYQGKTALFDTHLPEFDAINMTRQVARIVEVEYPNKWGAGASCLIAWGKNSTYENSTGYVAYESSTYRFILDGLKEDSTYKIKISVNKYPEGSYQVIDSIFVNTIGDSTVKQYADSNYPPEIRMYTKLCKRIDVWSAANTEPEITKAKIEWGETETYAQSQDYQELFSMFRRFYCENLQNNADYHCKISLKDPVGNVSASRDIVFNSEDDSTTIEEPMMRSGQLSASGNGKALSLTACPNPFNPFTVLQIHNANLKSEKALIRIYSVKGSLIKVIPAQTKATGNTAITWDARSVASGLYVASIECGGKKAVTKLFLIR